MYMNDTNKPSNILLSLAVHTQSNTLHYHINFTWCEVISACPFCWTTLQLSLCGQLSSSWQVEEKNWKKMNQWYHCRIGGFPPFPSIKPVVVVATTKSSSHCVEQGYIPSACHICYLWLSIPNDKYFAQTNAQLSDLQKSKIPNNSYSTKLFRTTRKVVAFSKKCMLY